MSDGEPSPKKEAKVSAIVLSVPPFYPHNPTLWFRILDAQFRNCRVRNDRDKFDQTLTRLPLDVATHVEDAIVTESFTALKEAVIRRFSPSHRERLQTLFGDLTLGDRTPSALLREMQRLLGDTHMEESVLRELWIKKLPDTLQGILEADSDRPLERAAAAADLISARLIHKPDTYVAHTQAPNTSLQSLSAEVKRLQATVNVTQAPRPTLDSVVDEVRQLRAAVNNMQRTLNRLSLNGSRAPTPRRQSRSPRRPFTQSTEGHCRFHNRFGAQARRCEPGCTFPGASQGKW